MTDVIDFDSKSDLQYMNFEVNRDSGSVNGDFLPLDGRGPIATGIQMARERGKLALLDAGCGTGHGLIDLKDQISFRTPIPEGSIEACGVSLSDVGAQFEGGWAERECLSNGYIIIRLGNLASIHLQPEHYDLAYSYEVLLHNEVVAPIIENVTSSLRVGGAYYFNSLAGQTEEIEGFVASQGAGLTLQSKLLNHQQIGGMVTRAVHKITKLH